MIKAINQKEMKKSQINYLYLLGFLFLFISCGKKPMFDEAYHFKDRIWSFNDTASFEVMVEDTTKQYDFILTLRTTTDYKYSNLWVHIASTAPDQSTSKVAQRINLARPDGSWIGRVSGTIVESKLHYSTTQFPLSGKYYFDITQAVHQDEIEEVLDLSLRIIEKEK